MTNTSDNSCNINKKWLNWQRTNGLDLGEVDTFRKGDFNGYTEIEIYSFK